MQEELQAKAAVRGPPVIDLTEELATARSEHASVLQSKSEEIESLRAQMSASSASDQTATLMEKVLALEVSLRFIVSKQRGTNLTKFEPSRESSRSCSGISLRLLLAWQRRRRRSACSLPRPRTCARYVSPFSLPVIPR